MSDPDPAVFERLSRDARGQSPRTIDPNVADIQFLDRPYGSRGAFDTDDSRKTRFEG